MLPKDASPTPSSHGGELCDTALDHMEEVASHIGVSPQMPFRFHNQIGHPPQVHHHLSTDKHAS